MEKIGNTYIYWGIKNECLFYARYIDDIAIIYTDREAKINNFIKNQNVIVQSAGPVENTDCTSAEE